MLKKWTLFVVLGLAALAAGDVVTPGGGGGGGGSIGVPVVDKGVVVGNGYAGTLSSDGAGGGVLRARVMPFTVPTGAAYYAICKQSGGECASGWVAIDEWYNSYIEYTCTDSGKVMLIYACTNDTDSGAADACAITYTEVQDNDSVCTP